MPTQTPIGTRPRLLIHDFKPLWPTWTSIIRPERANTVDDYQFTGSCAVIDNERHYLCDGMGLGKLLANSEPVLTPTGWTTMGQLRPGARVIGRDGKATEVLRVFPQGLQQIVKVTFSDGTWARASWDHLWTVQGVQNGHRHTMTTREIVDAKITDSAGNRRWKIPMTLPVEYDAVTLPLEPYLFGVLLGNGSLDRGFSITGDREIADALQLDGYHREHSSKGITQFYVKDKSVQTTIKELGLMGHRSWEKFVPDIFLRGTPQQRLALLQGLMDTDGYAMPDGGAEFCSTSENLMNAVIELTQSLGGIARGRRVASSAYTYKGETRQGRRAERVNLKLPAPMNPFRARKALLYKVPFKYQPTRTIVSVAEDGIEEATCIKVAAEDGLFLTRSFIVTHNTKQIIDAQRYVYMKQPEKLQRYLTICKGGGVDSFADEYAKHFPEARVVKFNVGPKERTQLFSAALLIMDSPVVFLVGYEIFNRMIDDFASDTIWDWIVLDEAHKACSTPLNKTQSSVAKNIHRVHSRRQTAMSGTPIPDLPEGAFNVNLWLGFDDRSWNQFADETLKLVSFSPSKNRPGFKLLKVVGYRQEGVKKLNAIVNSGVMTRRTQEDELDLPPAIYQTRYVSLNDEERRRYDIIVGELVEQANGTYEQEHFVELADGVRKVVNPLNKFDRLIQVTSSIECHTGEQYESSKIKACIELMDEIGDQKLIVFSRFIPVLRGLYRAFKKYNPAYITGGSSTKAGKDGSDSERRLMEKKFQEDPTCRVFLGSTMACKEQMTLTAGTVVALIDRLWVPKLNDQAIARARRIGTTRTVTVVSFEAPNTVDQYVSTRLKQKERTTNEIFDPEAFATEQMSIDQFIATLIS